MWEAAVLRRQECHFQSWSRPGCSLLLAAAEVRVMTVSQLEPHLATSSSSRSEVKDEGNVSPLSPYRQLNSFL